MGRKGTSSSREKSSNKRSRPRQFGLVTYSVAAVSGAVVMMLEVLGTRIISPFYGAGLYTWSSLISVTLIALAVGYWLGGIVADRGYAASLAKIMLAASLFIVSIPVLCPPVLVVTNALGVRFGSLVAAMALFFVPLTVLAMVGPIVIKHQTRDRLEAVGTASGKVLAISTAGSVLGTLLVGFWLLPMLGTKKILLGTSFLLFAFAISLFVAEHRSKTVKRGRVLMLTTIGLLLLVVGFGLPKLAKADFASDRFVVVSDTESLNGKVRVLDDLENRVRWLTSDASIIGAEQRDTGEPLFPYLSVLELLPLLKRDAKSALIIGLGAGHLSRSFTRTGIQTDAIEIDPAIAKVAKIYFGYRPSGRLFVGDARRKVRHLSQTYDIIVHDCFSGGAVSAHLLSVEMFQTLRARLAQGGVLAVNYFGYTSGENGAALAAIRRTMAKVFKHQRLFVSQPNQELIDNLLIASDQPLDFGANVFAHRAVTPANRWVIEHLAQLEQTEWPVSPGFLITDDYNPLESMQADKAVAYRQMLAARLGLPILAY